MIVVRGPIFLLVLATASAALADAGDTITVTGHALPQPLGAAAYGSILLDRDRLTEEPSRRLDSVLRDVAGFQGFRRADSRAAHPTAQGAGLRALGGNAASRALVLLDGVPQADPFGGWVPWPALDPERLSAVRVTRGGGAGAFGPGALAGTIELFSAGPDDLAPFAADLRYGSRDSVEASAGAAARLDSGFFTLSGRFDRGDGYVLLPERQRGPVDVPAGYEQWSIGGRGVMALGDDGTELQLRALVFGDERRRGVVGADSTSRGYDASIRVVGRGDWAWEALAYVQDRRFTAGFMSVAADRTTATPALDQYDTPATGLGAKVEVRPPLGAAHQLRFGLDVRHAKGETNEHFFRQNDRFTRERHAGGRSRTLGAYVEHGWKATDALTLTGGLRLDRWWIENGFFREGVIATGATLTDQDHPDRAGWETTARAGLTYALTPALSARAAAYRGFRLPTLNELFRPFRVGNDTTTANAGLSPEDLEGVEIGLDFTPLSTARFGVTLFANRVEDAIANVTLSSTPSATTRRRENVDSIRSRGVELNASLALDRWSLAASYAFADAEVSGSGLAADLDGRRPAQTPRHHASATLGYAVPDGPSAAVTARYVSAQFEDDLESRCLDSAFTVDATATVPLRHGFALTLAAENLFNEEIQAGISDAGIIDRGTPRTLWVGLRWAMGR